MKRNRIIANGIGSDVIITQGKKCLFFNKIQKGKRVISKKVLEIAEKQIKDYKFIGKAEGMNLFHCLYLASKYCKNLEDRVVAYLIVAPSRKNCNFAISFYEKKKVS